MFHVQVQKLTRERPTLRVQMELVNYSTLQTWGVVDKWRLPFRTDTIMPRATTQGLRLYTRTLDQKRA